MDDNLLELSRILSASDGTGVIQVTGSSLDASNTPITSSFFTGDGSALTNITASYLPGIDGSQLLNVTASYISPDIPIPVGGNNTQIQFNSGSALSGSNHLVYNYNSQSLAHGDDNHQTIGLYSHAEGSTSITLGNYSHTEGENTKTGAYGYAISSISFNGTDTEIALDNSYGDVTSIFVANNSYLLIKDESASRFYKYNSFTDNWDGSNTIITIPDINLTTIFSSSDTVFVSDFLKFNLVFKPINSDTPSTGDYSHAEGYLTNAVSDYSHAEGFRSLAASLYAHAEGRETIALGNSSHVEGYRTIASGDYQLVIGQWNEPLPSQSAFIIGDGTSENDRHNVLFVSKSHFEVSASNMYLQGLANSSQTYVVAIDTATGKLSYTLASGVGSLTPAGGANTNIQFNSASAFSGSNNFAYDYTASIVILTGSLRVSGSTTLTGSMFVSGTVSASFGSNTVGFFGTASWAQSASQAVSASYALSASNASTASFVITASYITGSTFTDTNPALSASYALSASRAMTASLALTASYVTGSIFTSTNPALTASYALFSLNGGSSTTPEGNIGDIQYNVDGTNFGGVSVLTYDGTDLTATGSFTGSFVGSFLGTSSWAESASQAVTASYINGSTFTSTNRALSASNALTASYVSGSIFTSTNRALSASNALTASYVPSIRASSASAADFSIIGGDYGTVIALNPTFPNNNYAVTVTGEDARGWTIESKSNTQFTIQSNSAIALTGPVYWIAIPFNN
jgi:hypothetical protein